MAKFKVLVIDDNPIHRESAKKQLGGKYDVTVVATLSEGRALFSSHNIVLSDDIIPPDYQDGIKRWDLLLEELLRK